MIQTRRAKTKKIRKLLFSLFLTSILIVALTFMYDKRVFWVRNVNIDLVDGFDYTENTKEDIKKVLKEEIKGKTLIYFFDKAKEEERLKESIRLSAPNLDRIVFKQNYDTSLDVKLYFFERGFTGCISEEDFLIPCMVSDTSGYFYREVDADFDQGEKTEDNFYISVDKEILFTKNGLKIETPESLSETRMGSQDDYRAFIIYYDFLKKEGYKILRAKLTKDKIVMFTTDKIDIYFNLKDDIKDTLNEFTSLKNENIFKNFSKNSDFWKNGELLYLDFSYTGKALYKYKNYEKNDDLKIKNATTSTTTILKKIN